MAEPGVAQPVGTSTTLNGVAAPHPNGSALSGTPAPNGLGGHIENNNGAKDDKKKRRKKKKKKPAKKSQQQQQLGEVDTSIVKTEPSTEPPVEVEYIREEVQLDEGLSDFASVFAKFARPEELAEANSQVLKDRQKEKDRDGRTDEDVKDENGDTKKKSKKARKLEKRLSIAVLKQIVTRPEVVEVHDVNAPDPGFLVHLKSYRNSVPVPRHWSQKRKYLTGKRGVEKPPFELPDFIAATGIGKIRAALQAKEDEKRLKQKQRERTRPKMHKMDIDYQVLHDAFFKYQTKPKLTVMGDLYYENKEFEVALREKKPGILSEDMKRALGMPEGAPPPWLLNMQRFGLPPSYPNQKIPGLNAPLPPGARPGFGPGEWGKPPVDEYGRPLYGDINMFDSAAAALPPTAAPIQREPWGAVEYASEEEEEEEEEEGKEEEGEGEEQAEGEGEDGSSGAVEYVEGFQSVPAGLETPEILDVRKQKRSAEDENRPLFQVLEQTSSKVSGVYGSSHKYVVPGNKQTVDVALQPNEIEELEAAGEDLLRKKYVRAVSDKTGDDVVAREDLSDMVAENNAKKQMKDDKGKKKYKEFRF
eukprot:TRINITY_DN1808_c0_g1_i3.p1 TRINITY_DN1808_c0_g1~~TRINITY_DN1808_c0_g1_i3.p1  ORF type:complete len:587 (+),score=207.00 TRINITY_DN1808_c0_g1_i3:62-1822(+)